MTRGERPRLRILRRIKSGGPEAALRRRPGRVGIALVYHRVAERGGDPHRELVPPIGRRTLAEHLRHLSREYRLVGASNLLPAVHEREPGEPIPVALTFDDDLISHRELAAPLLREREVPATFFLTGASLGGPSPMWWDLVQIAADRKELAGEGIHDAGNTFELMAPAERARRTADLAERYADAVGEPGLRVDDVRALAEAGFEIGFHTVRHDILTELDDDALRRGLHDGHAELERAAAHRIDSLAYPHGRADARVAAAARDAGFAHGFTGEPDAARPKSDPLLLGRIDPATLTADQLAVWLLELLEAALGEAAQPVGRHRSDGRAGGAASD